MDNRNTPSTRPPRPTGPVERRPSRALPPRTSRTLTELDVRRADGEVFPVSATSFVLATGGLEVPRLLLAWVDCWAAAADWVACCPGRRGARWRPGPWACCWATRARANWAARP